jgi:hypothetical protein
MTGGAGNRESLRTPCEFALTLSDFLLAVSMVKAIVGRVTVNECWSQADASSASAGEGPGLAPGKKRTPMPGSVMK